MNTDAADFLEALLFTLPEDHPSHCNEWTPRAFHPEFIAAVERLCDGFREYLYNRRAELRDKGFSEETVECLHPDEGERSFGSNIYFSLSGHGCGFWDDREFEWAEAMQAALVEFAGGDRHRFEQIDLMKFHGKIHFSLRGAALRREELAKVFAIPCPATA